MATAWAFVHVYSTWCDWGLLSQRGTWKWIAYEIFCSANVNIWENIGTYASLRSLNRCAYAYDTTQDKDEGKLNGSWTNHKWNMNETWTNFFTVRSRTSFWNTAPIVHRSRTNSSCVVHVWFVHERFLLISFLSFILSRTNENPRFFSFMFNVRSSSDERMFVRPSCGNGAIWSTRIQNSDKNLYFACI